MIRLAILLLLATAAHAGEIDDKAVVRSAVAKTWNSFPLSSTRLLPGTPFYKAMEVSQQYLLGMDVDRMLNGLRRRAGLAMKEGVYPGSSQPAGTRPGDLWHYLSGVSLMYAQTGDQRFRERADYIISTMTLVQKSTTDRIAAGDTTLRRRFQEGWKKILGGSITLSGPDETGYPWGGTTGNDWYGIHKQLAGYRDAYLYCDNREALRIWTNEADEITDFVLKANPDLFDDMLDLEHGGMNEVFADLYALTGDHRYMQVSRKFNHQKVVLNIATGNDVLYGRHANAQVPIFNGTARQYQLTGDETSRKATENFLKMVLHDHTTVIGGNGRYERFGKPGAISGLLGFTSNETCNTYNMLKVASNYFQSTGDLEMMDYFERGLYNHILASQDTESAGVTYYMALMPGSFKSFSKGYDLSGVWCCVGTGMENHSKYGESVYFHNNKDLFINLFIGSELHWKEKGLKLNQETGFPSTDEISVTVTENQSFNGQLYIRYPKWVKNNASISINGEAVGVKEIPGEYIRLNKMLKPGDKITIKFPQEFRIEAAQDNPQLVSILRGPIVMAAELGAESMPGPDLVQQAHFRYRNWITKTDDIPYVIGSRLSPSDWIIKTTGSSSNSSHEPDRYRTVNAGWLNEKASDFSLIPFYKIRHQRFTVYLHMYNADEYALRKKIVSDEIEPGNIANEKKHNLQGSYTDTSSAKDGRDFWEMNRYGRYASEGGWFSYDMKISPAGMKEATTTSATTKYLFVTYWGTTPRNHEFDVLINDQKIASEELYEKHPLLYFDKIYKIPANLLSNKKQFTVTFKAKPGKTAGPVYGLKVTTDPQAFPGYSFYRF